MTTKYTHLNNRLLKDWYHITIETIVKDNPDDLEWWESTSYKQVHFHSKIHVNKIVKINPVFSTEFTDEEILKDKTLYSSIVEKYGNVTR